jgi:hypothetical protein
MIVPVAAATVETDRQTQPSLPQLRADALILPALMVFENKAQPAVRPRPRGQACGHEPAREDAGAPSRRHWLHLILKDHQSRARITWSLRRPEKSVVDATKIQSAPYQPHEF